MQRVELRRMLLLLVATNLALHTGCTVPDQYFAKNTATLVRGEPINGVIVTAEQVTPAALADWKQQSVNVALMLTDEKSSVAETTAANQILAAGLKLDYFIEVGRCPELAAAHPEWMASLQGHAEWRRLFPDVPEPTDRQVIKNSPWVPVLYRESFEAHSDRIKQLLSNKPAAQRIWLNDLQGAPSACGCGHPLCRWTADYGPIKTATPLGQDAAAKFVATIKSLATSSEVIPIFVGECEADDEDTICCGVACFKGKCWRDFTLQLDALAAESPLIGVACFYQAFERDLPRYGEPAGWVAFTIDSFSDMPQRRDGTGVTPDRLIAVLQGWNVSSEQVAAQIAQAKQVDAAGWLISLTPIEQSWEPVLFDLPASIVVDPNVEPANDHDHH